jgi:hypothetical protein
MGFMCKCVFCGWARAFDLDRLGWWCRPWEARGPSSPGVDRPPPYQSNKRLHDRTHAPTHRHPHTDYGLHARTRLQSFLSSCSLMHSPRRSVSIHCSIILLLHSRPHAAAAASSAWGPELLPVVSLRVRTHAPLACCLPAGLCVCGVSVLGKSGGL